MDLIGPAQAAVKLAKVCQLTGRDFDEVWTEMKREFLEDGEYTSERFTQLVRSIEQRIFIEWARGKYANDMGEFVMQFRGGPWDGHVWTRHDILAGVRVNQGEEALGSYMAKVDEQTVWYEWYPGAEELL